nr:reverse transcriptase domain-containing protein [Tanacetum cinerariifolium]
MHNNIMAAGSRDHLPMLATGRYAQWRSRFLQYIDTRPNGDALRKCILEGPYTPTTVVVVVPATVDSPAVLEHTAVETPMNMSTENKAHYESEKEAINLILTRIGDEIYSIVDACKTAQEMWKAIERLQQGKEIAKPITPPSESDFKEDSDPEQAQRDKDMQKILALIAKYFKKITNLPTTTSEILQTLETRMWILVVSFDSRSIGIDDDCCFVNILSTDNEDSKLFTTAKGFDLECQDTFYNGLTLRHRDTINAVAGGTFMKRRLGECYDLIENMTAHHNDWDTSAQRSESSSSITSSSDSEIVALKAEMAKINKNLMKVLQINQQVKAGAHNCETCGGPHSYNDCPAIVGQTQNVYAAGPYNQGGNSYQPQGNIVTNSRVTSSWREIVSLKFSEAGVLHVNWISFGHCVNQGNNHGIPQGNNQRRNQFFQGVSHDTNTPPAYQAPAYQASGYQAPVHQPPIPQPQVVTTTKFTNYMKANDAILKNMQTNMTSLTNPNLELKNMFGQFMKMNTASSLGSRTLPSNTVTNPKEDLKGITTRSGTAYQGPTISTTSSSLPQVVERETELTKDTVPPTNNESTKDAKALVVQIKTPVPNSEPVVAPIIKPVVAPNG